MQGPNQAVAGDSKRVLEPRKWRDQAWDCWNGNSEKNRNRH